ncbi:Anaphase-promoting complex subunit 4 WD40 domain-containing protein [[Candida] zeylanoides]
MSISPGSLFPPQPSTARAQSLRLSYDAKNDRICYPSGKSVIVRAVDPAVAAATQFTKHIVAVTCAAFSPNGNYVASGDEAGNVKIWDAAPAASDAAAAAAGGSGTDAFSQPHVKSEFEVLSGPIRAIAWDADGTRLIAVGQGKGRFGHCFTWDSGNSIGEIQGHADTINAVDIRPQRPYRAATVGDKAFVFFHGPPFKFDRTVRGHHTNTVRDVRFSPSGLHVVSVSADRSVVLYDGKTGDFVAQLAAHDGGIFGVAWTGADTFATCSADATVKTWRVEEAKILPTATYVVSQSPTVEDQQVGLVATPHYLISLSASGSLNYFAHGEAAAPQVVSGVRSAITAAACTSSAVVVGTSDGSVVRIGLDGTAFVPKPQILAGHSNYVSSIVADPLVTAGWDDKLRIGDNVVALSGQPKKVLCHEGYLVLFETRLEWYKDGALDSALDFDYTASDVSASGSTLYVTNTTANRIEVYADFAHQRSFAAQRAAPAVVRASPDGQYVAVADTFGKYTLYAANGTVVTTRWAFHNARVLDAAWSPDSSFLVSGGLDTGILVYSVARPAKVLKYLLAHQTAVSSVAWASYGTSATVVSTGLDAVVKSWIVDLSVY